MEKLIPAKVMRWECYERNDQCDMSMREDKGKRIHLREIRSKSTATKVISLSGR